MKIILSAFILPLSLSFLFNLSNKNEKNNLIENQFIEEENSYFGGYISKEGGDFIASKAVVPVDNYYNTQKDYSMDMIGDIEGCWDYFTGKGTTIAVIDDGFNYEHPEYIREDGSSIILDSSRYYYSNTAGTLYYYQSYSSDHSVIKEDYVKNSWNKHGTNTSTTAVAPMNNDGIVGIAPEADLLALKVDMSFAAIYGAMKYAIEQKVDVISISIQAYAEKFTDPFGVEPSYSSANATYLNEVCQEAYDAGIIVVAAAGNHATTHKSYPACNSKVIGVGGLYRNDTNTLAPFTNYNSYNESGELNVDILAPGYVYAAGISGTSTSYEHTYNSTSGTSFSCPIVSGAACLWKEKYPEGTPNEFLNQLQTSAAGISTYTNKNIPATYSGASNDVGPSNINQGRIDIGSLLEIEDPYILLKDKEIDINVGDNAQIEFKNAIGDITYSSSNNNIAVVDSNGVITGQGTGTALITVNATKNNKNTSKTLVVHVDNGVEVESLTVNPSSINLTVGDIYEIQPTIETIPSNASQVFIYSSYDSNIATVDVDFGTVEAISTGEVDIEIMSYDLNGYGVLHVTVIDDVPAEPEQFNISCTYASKGTNWSLTNCSDSSTYWLCPSGSYSSSIALIPNIFNNRLISSDIVITINHATYSSGNNPDDNTFKIYNSSSCTSLVASSRTGSLATSSSFENAIFTVSKDNASSFVDDLAILITKPGKQIRLKSINVSFTYLNKTISSIELFNEPDDLEYYEGQNFDPTGLSIIRHFSDKTSDTLTYLGNESSFSFSPSLSTPLSISINEIIVTYNEKQLSIDITVNPDAISSISASAKGIYHPGDVINKNDITLSVNYLSGKVTHPTDFIFNNDGYVFKYIDTVGGEEISTKEFMIIYNTQNINFNVNISRNAYIEPDNVNLILNSSTFSSIGGSNSSLKNGTLIKNSYTFEYYQSYYYTGGSSLSFGNASSQNGYFKNVTPFTNGIVDVTPSLKSGSRNVKVKYSEDGNSWIKKANADNNKIYKYFKIDCEGITGTNYSNITSISITYKGIDNVINVSNYIMYEDNENQCLTKLDIAIDKLNNMSLDDKNEFIASDNYVIHSAYERIVDWAKHEHKEFALEDGEFILTSNRIVSEVMDFDYFSIIIVVFSIFGIIALSYVFKKKYK